VRVNACSGVWREEGEGGGWGLRITSQFLSDAVISKVIDQFLHVYIFYSSVSDDWTERQRGRVGGLG